MSGHGPAEHHYGPRVCLHGDPWSLTALARLSGTEVQPTELLALVRSLYTGLVQRALGDALVTVETAVPTRMAARHPERGLWHGRVFDPAQEVVVIDVVRGGIVPAQTCYEELVRVLPAEKVRLDHLVLARRVDEAGRVVGADLGASKVGGSVEGAVVVVPDPMGATGSTLRAVLDHLVERHGRPLKVLALPLIVTPEFLRAVLDHDPDTVVHAWRVDRGTSAPEVLDTVPGTHWERERGLDERDYIVPGAGGLGEVLNNSWC